MRLKTVTDIHLEQFRCCQLIAFDIFIEWHGHIPIKPEMHVILDNLNTHKPKNDRWLARHSNVHFHYTPTHASWLNQVEIWFFILQAKSLKRASFNSPKQLREQIDAFIVAYNQTAQPFEWTKQVVFQKHPKTQCANLCK